MKYSIEENKGKLTVIVDQIPDEEARKKILNLFMGCQTGSCRYKTTENEKLNGLEMEQTEDSLHFTLVPKSGINFNVEKIKQCLEYAIVR